MAKLGAGGDLTLASFAYAFLAVIALAAHTVLAFVAVVMFTLRLAVVELLFDVTFALRPHAAAPTLAVRAGTLTFSKTAFHGARWTPCVNNVFVLLLYNFHDICYRDCDRRTGLYWSLQTLSLLHRPEYRSFKLTIQQKPSTL